MIYAISEKYEIKKKSYTFRQKHSSGIINRSLNYVFMSNQLQEFSNDTDIIPAFKTDHSSVLVTISNYNVLNQAQVFGNLITH